jgi:iron only hydrogenase large subunit-like protein
MACEGGCVGGPGSLNHSSKAKLFVNQYSRAAMFRTIAQANSSVPVVQASVLNSEPSPKAE